MSNQPFPAPLPVPGDATIPGVEDADRLEPTREEDGRDVLDHDLDDARIDSAAADVIASGADPES